jgi:ferritin-like metal-binding protein YciE
MSLNSLEDVFVEQLKDIYSAEKQLTEALPQMAKAASAAELRTAFQNHLAKSEQHMQAVRTILAELDENPTNTFCKAMAGLVEEAEEIVKGNGNADAKDVALIVAAQKVEHYEIASYGSLCAFAKTLGYEQAAQTLQSILDEEYEADQELDNLAMGVHQKAGLNRAARQS